MANVHHGDGVALYGEQHPIFVLSFAIKHLAEFHRNRSVSPREVANCPDAPYYSRVHIPGASSNMSHPRPATVGQLKETGYRPRSVKDELRANVIRKLKSGEELFPGIVGYRETVLPQIVNGILSKHDLLFLGLRGQAKTRILRMLPLLLDEWMPVLAGVEINDDPLTPGTKSGRRLIAEQEVSSRSCSSETTE